MSTLMRICVPLCNLVNLHKVMSKMSEIHSDASYVTDFDN